jgi:hypothetical protein
MRLTVGDGPVGEQRLQIARFNILECADLDEAIEVVSKTPWSVLRRVGVASHGRVTADFRDLRWALPCNSD